MPDHKLEPFEKVLVRDFDTQNWKADLFSHRSIEDGDTFFVCMGEAAWLQCIPYTQETVHLLGTAQPYEPPKPPVEYEWGQKVEVLSNGSDWERGIWIKLADNTECPQRHFVALEYGVFIWCKENEIRPLPDDTADTVKCGICGKPINERTAANDVECGPCCPEHYEDDTAANADD